MPVAGVHHPDSAPEVEQPVAIGVGEHSSLSVHHRYWRHRRYPSGNRLGPPGKKGAAVGTGYLGLETDDA